MSRTSRVALRADHGEVDEVEDVLRHHAADDGQGEGENRPGAHRGLGVGESRTSPNARRLLDDLQAAQAVEGGGELVAAHGSELGQRLEVVEAATARHVEHVVEVLAERAAGDAVATEPLQQHADRPRLRVVDEVGRGIAGAGIVVGTAETLDGADLDRAPLARSGEDGALSFAVPAGAHYALVGAKGRATRWLYLAPAASDHPDHALAERHVSRPASA